METIHLLKQHLRAFYPLPDEVVTALAAQWVPVSFKRKETITRQGAQEQYLYFVTEGIQQAVAVAGDREATLVFSYPYSFSGVVDSFLTQTPASCRLEAITRSRLLRIHHQQLLQLAAQYPVLHTWLWQALALVLKGTLDRQAELLLANAEDKFTALLRRSPQVLNLIPHKYLASYIGVDASTFSKLLRSVRL